MTITMTRAQYDALVAAGLNDETVEILRLREEIDAANGVTRYVLNIRWQDVGGSPPPRIELGRGWPPDQTFMLELERPISRADVDEVLRTQAVNPASVMVTPDTAGVVGWTLLEDYSW